MLNRNLLFVALTAGSLVLGCGGSSSTTSSSGGGGAGGASSQSINGCTAATATDNTANSSVTIKFGGGFGLTYSPACVKVKAGTKVVFNGDFTTHPLVGGDGDGTPTVDAASPIKATATGMTATFTLPKAGTFPFYCAHHVASGMKGAIFVE